MNQQMTLDPNDVVSAVTRQRDAALNQVAMLEAAVSKLQRDLADANKPKVDPAE
jgi:hypothetical protein